MRAHRAALLAAVLLASAPSGPGYAVTDEPAAPDHTVTDEFGRPITSWMLPPETRPVWGRAWRRGHSRRGAARGTHERDVPPKEDELSPEKEDELSPEEDELFEREEPSNDAIEARAGREQTAPNQSGRRLERFGPDATVQVAAGGPHGSPAEVGKDPQLQ